MKEFEVLVPDKTNTTEKRTIVVKAMDSFSALHNAMTLLQETIDTSSLDCEFAEDGRIFATEYATGRVIEVRYHSPHVAQHEKLAVVDKPAAGSHLMSTIELPLPGINLDITEELPAINAMIPPLTQPTLSPPSQSKLKPKPESQPTDKQLAYMQPPPPPPLPSSVSGDFDEGSTDSSIPSLEDVIAQKPAIHAAETVLLHAISEEEASAVLADTAQRNNSLFDQNTGKFRVPKPSSPPKGPKSSK